MGRRAQGSKKKSASRRQSRRQAFGRFLDGAKRSLFRGCQFEPLEQRQLLAYYAVDYTGSGNNPFADSTDSTTHGGTGTRQSVSDGQRARRHPGCHTSAGENTISLPAGTYTLTNSGAGSLNITATWRSSVPARRARLSSPAPAPTAVCTPCLTFHPAPTPRSRR